MGPITKWQARAFFLGSTDVFSLSFVGLTVDGHRQFPQNILRNPNRTEWMDEGMVQSATGDP
jgi:hypothetical protein